MNELFSQGGKGSTGILTNKQAVARHFGVKQSEVVYFSVGAPLTGYKVIYDKESQRAYSLPADIGSGVTAVSLSPAGVLVHSAGNVDLGTLAVAREEYVTLPGSFTTGVTVNSKNELVVFTDGKYRWDGTLPKEVPAGSTPESAGGVGIGAWLSIGSASISYLEKQNYELWNFALQRVGYNLVGFLSAGVEISTPGDVVLDKNEAKAYRYVGDLPHVISTEDVPSDTSKWREVSLNGIEASREDLIRDAISRGMFSVNRNADFIIDGQIPGAYGRVNRNFSDGQKYEYASKKYHKETFGIFEDACVLSAIACERDLERPTQILGAATGQLIAQYGSTDTAATYFENYALPPVYIASSATYGATYAANLTGLDTSKLRLNMVAVVTGTSTWFGLVRGWTNDSITVDGWYEKTSGNAGTPSGSLSISPVYRVWGNNTIVTVPEDAAATSAVGMEVMLNLYKDGTGVDSQIYKAINNNAFNHDEIVDSAYQAVGKFGKAHDVWPGSTYSYRSWGATSYGFFSDHDQSGIKILTPNDAAFVLASQVGGVGAETNVLIIDPAGSIIQTNQKAVNEVAAQFGANGASGVVIRQQGSGGANASDAVMFVGKASATDRSINCAGTVNSSGADYAEYFYKSDSCGEIAKGDICGIDKDGKITDIYDNSVSFMIKSTEPCLVGGDSWSVKDRPQYPSAEWEEWNRAVNSPKPTKPDQSSIKLLIAKGVLDEKNASDLYASMLSQYEEELDKWKSNKEKLQENEPSKESEDYSSWLMELETHRRKVDRLAYCGRVPVNVSGGYPGDYLIPIEKEDGRIYGKYVSNPSFEEYKKAVGKVHSISDGGVTIVSVLVH